MTETAVVDPIAERFARETEHHEMTILHDHGLYRHVRFRNPKDSAYWYDLITVPGSLIFRGDGESFVFARLKDMFGFFRSNPDRLTHRINPGYWSEKLTSDRDSVKKYSRGKLDKHVADILSEVEEEWPGITAGWKTLADDSYDYDLDHEEVARQALNDFEFGAKERTACSCGQSAEYDANDVIPMEWRTKHVMHRYTTRRIDGFRFSDTWEWDLKDYDWWFLWACHGIVHGIAQYDQAKATAARCVQAAAVMAGTVA